MKFFNKFNYINVFTILYLVFFIFLLSYTIYRAEFIHQANQFNYYYKYYLIFSIGIFFWTIIFFLNRTHKIKIIVGSTSLIFLLYGYESYLTIQNSKINFKDNWQMTTVQAKLNLIDKIKKRDEIDVVPSIFPRAILDRNWKDNIFPIGGISNTTTVYCKEGEKFSIYKSDRYGFNNPDDMWDKAKISWFLIGDSFTQGSCVQPGEDLASQIRKLTKQNVISVGMSGNGPLIELASLKEYGEKKSPEIILWIYFERNDLDDLKHEKTNKIFMNYLNDFNQGLFYKQNEIDDKLKKYIKIIEKEIKKKERFVKKNVDYFLLLKKIIRLQVLRDKLALDRGLNLDVDPLFKEIIVSSKDFINKWDGKLYFVYLPDKERYASKNINHDSYLNKSKIIKIINDLDIPLIDIHEEFFIKQDDPIEFYAHRIYGHYSPDGYHKVAETIVKKVNEFK